jgi:hypothetical protein
MHLVKIASPETLSLSKTTEKLLKNYCPRAKGSFTFEKKKKLIRSYNRTS